MAGQSPYQLLNGPVNVYFADPASLPPDVATPTASIDTNVWTIFGTEGDQDLFEDGVKIMADQSVAEFIGLGSIGPRKMFRENQHVRVEFKLADVSVEYVSRFLNGNAINLDSHRRRVEYQMSADVEQVALLIRSNKSPYGDFNSQHWFPRCSHDANTELLYVKGAPVGIQFRYTALVDSDYGVGFYDGQDEVS